MAAKTAIELTEAEQDLLWEMWDLNRTSVGEAISRAGSAEQLDAAIRRAQLYVPLLNAAETGIFEPSDDAVGLVREHRDETLKAADHDGWDLRKLRAGDMDYCGIGLRHSRPSRK